MLLYRRIITKKFLIERILETRIPISNSYLLEIGEYFVLLSFIISEKFSDSFFCTRPAYTLSKLIQQLYDNNSKTNEVARYKLRIDKL